MSQGEELLNTLSEEGISLYSANPATEEHIVIDSDRRVSVPRSLERLGVQHDHDVETVTFDCPRYWDNHDMSKWRVFINYIRSDGNLGSYEAPKIEVDTTDDKIMHFNWTIDGYATEVFGDLSFLVCAVEYDSEGKEIHHWNSELCEGAYISEGLACNTAIAERYPGIISQILVKISTGEDAMNEIYQKVNKNTTDLGNISFLIEAHEAQLNDLYDTTVGLDLRVSEIEKNGVPGGGSGGNIVQTVQADYEENDPTAAEYIHNRPFYDTGEVKVHDITLLDNVDTGDLGDRTSLPTFGFVDGNLNDNHTVTVTYGGVSKEFPVMYDENTSGFIGNNVPYHYVGDNQIALNNGTQTSAIYGFAITKFIENPEYIGGSAATGNIVAAVTDIQSLCSSFGLDVANAGAYTMSVRQHYEEHIGLKKIDPKYLPDGVRKIETVTAAELESGSIDLSKFEVGTIVFLLGGEM